LNTSALSSSTSLTVISAMMEAESGGGEETTIDEIMAALNAKD
jgi:hypothetical protein